MFSIESPDLFRNINNLPHTNSACIDLSISDEEKSNIDDDITNIESSPTITNKYKKIHKRVQKSDHKENLVNRNVFQKDSDHDMSVIDCTPETSRTRTDIKTKGDLSKKRSKQSKSTRSNQLFSKSLKRKVKSLDNNIKLDNDSDETYYEENSDGEQMQITDLLSYINKLEPMETECVQQNDSGTSKK